MTQEAREFNTGEHTPGDSQTKEPITPAEKVAAAGSRLIGILGSLPMSDVEFLTKSGGVSGMISDYLETRDLLESALLENARLIGNQEVVDSLLEDLRGYHPGQDMF